MRGKKNDPNKFIGRPVWAEVSVSALADNYRTIRDYINPTSEKRKTARKVLSIVKGNGYGHGGAQVAKALEKVGSDWFGVASAGEGIEIRNNGVSTPILVLGGFWPGEEKNFLEYDLTPAIHRCEQLATFEAAAARRRKKHVPIHVKVDTGMNRLGIAPSDADCFARQLAKCRRLELAGVFTHFASSEVLNDSPTGIQTRLQTERFYTAVDRLRALKVDTGLLHLANSAAIAARPETWADMVRPGAILYGYHPGLEPVERRNRDRIETSAAAGHEPARAADRPAHGSPRRQCGLQRQLGGAAAIENGGDVGGIRRRHSSLAGQSRQRVYPRAPRTDDRDYFHGCDAAGRDRRSGCGHGRCGDGLRDGRR